MISVFFLPICIDSYRQAGAAEYNSDVKAASEKIVTELIPT